MYFSSMPLGSDYFSYLFLPEVSPAPVNLIPILTSTTRCNPEAEVCRQCMSGLLGEPLEVVF